MTPKKIRNLTKLSEAIVELSALVSLFESESLYDETREDLQAKADVLTSALLETGMVGNPTDDFLLRLDDVLGAMASPLKNKARHARTFYRALARYDDDEGNLIDQAKDAFDQFGTDLLKHLVDEEKKWSAKER